MADVQAHRQNEQQEGHWAKNKGTFSGPLSQIEEVRGGSGYASQNDPRVIFGLGKKNRAELIEIRWPSGKIQKLRNVPANQILTGVEP
ncbi:MAG: ASPIC/UnbV domain-containing protein [Candidatus Latescibacteria bacterium]|nr:ASPIC/UnbV domain-containing protein [Candidatus Latescibacterota bacterium]